jgi:hypothetical protein
MYLPTLEWGDFKAFYLSLAFTGEITISGDEIKISVEAEAGGSNVVDWLGGLKNNQL